MIAFIPRWRRRLAAPPCQIRLVCSRLTSYSAPRDVVNHVPRLAGPSRTRLPQIVADLVLWLGWVSRPVAAPPIGFLCLEAREV